MYTLTPRPTQQIWHDRNRRSRVTPTLRCCLARDSSPNSHAEISSLCRTVPSSDVDHASEPAVSSTYAPLRHVERSVSAELCEFVGPTPSAPPSSSPCSTEASITSVQTLNLHHSHHQCRRLPYTPYRPHCPSPACNSELRTQLASSMSTSTTVPTSYPRLCIDSSRGTARSAEQSSQYPH